MKRWPELRDLSEDHHRALLLARRAARAAAAGEQAARVVWSEAVVPEAAALEAHFGIEESVLLPALEELGESALCHRTRREHQRLRELLSGERRDADALAELGQLLADHVRMEERELFQVAQQRLSPQTLASVMAARQAMDPPTTAEPCASPPCLLNEVDPAYSGLGSGHPRSPPRPHGKR